MSGTDPYAGGTDPYAGGTDPYAGGTDPYVGGTDPYAGGHDDSRDHGANAPGAGFTGTPDAAHDESDDDSRTDFSRADTVYRAVIDVSRLPGIVVPAPTVMVQERRGGGWSGVARVNPRLTSAEAAFDVLLRDGLMPGSAVLVKLVLPAGSRYEGIVVRSWPSVITSVSTRWWRSDHSDGEAFAGITFRDALTYLRSRPIWAAFADCSPGEILGGALSSAAGGDGRPTREPVLPGMSTVVLIREGLRADIGKVPYAIAAGEPMGYWLSRVLGRLGVRIEMRGDAAGRLLVELNDGKPSESGVNRDGGVWMTVDPRAVPSAANLVPDSMGAGAAVPDRGGLLDDPARGGAKRFGRPGPVETVIVSDGTKVAEAEKRATFRRARESVSRVRLSMQSRQPGLLPGRVVKIGIPPHRLFGANRGTGQVDGYVSLLGANRWQVADVSHVYSYGGYRNRAEIEKVGAGWRPPVPPDDGVKLISGIVDDGESELGEEVKRDRLGRIPVKFPFFFDTFGGSDDDDAGTDENSEGADDDDAATDDAPSPATGDRRWSPALRLAPVEPVAGDLHGFVRGHRQGDWCRVAVVDPFYAEVAGFSYREDRYLSARIGDATMGMVVRQGADEWRGMLFRPDEDLERELEDAESDLEDSESDDEDS